MIFSNLSKGLISVSPANFWRDHEKVLLSLALIARDILSIPATGASVERLFNSARDICHYRRGSLSSETISALILYMFAIKFDLNKDQIALCERYQSKEEKDLRYSENSPFLSESELISEEKRGREEEEEEAEEEESESEVREQEADSE